MTPCPTCRHEVDHLIALDIEINAIHALAEHLTEHTQGVAA